MSLVAYASSDDDSENEEEIAIPVPKKREPVKISIPSLTEFKEESDPEVTKKPKPKGGSGLFSLLPPPKNSNILSKPGFTPYVFSKKKELGSNSKSSIQKQIKPTVVEESSKDINSSVIDNSKDSPEKIDFFSLGTNSNTDDKTSSISQNNLSDSPSSANFLPNRHIASTSEQFLPERVSCYSNFASVDDGNSSTNLDLNYSLNEAAVPIADSSAVNLNLDSSDTVAQSALQQDLLKDEGFMKLKGRRGMEEINIIDINADDQLVGKEEYMMKSLTEEKVIRPSKRRHDMPTQQQKRKHQITYLAFQAKERELDLKNQWAHNSRTRRETQAKYGF